MSLPPTSEALPPGVLVTGTDTGVGKTVVAAAVVARLRADGVDVGAHKPAVTGTDDAPDPDWPPDHELLAAASGDDAALVAPRRYGPAVSPHLAIALAGTPSPGLDALLASARAAGEGREALVVEGVGGLLVPLTAELSVRGYAVALGLPLVLVARPGLGTINHTLLTLEAARAVGLEVRAVVVSAWPAVPTPMERDNAATIERLGGVPVHVLPVVERGDPALLARAAADLPVRAWLGAP